ncbi:MAG TPA: M23 family metallopeptidase [Terriglobia bacterium]|nr:M23 family metallopeptidase [Terriglobia bacterium]
MRKSYHKPRAGSGNGWIVLLLVLIAGIAILGWKVFSREAPLIKFSEAVKGIGNQTAVEFTVHDNEYLLKNVSVVVRQENRSFSVPLASEIHNAPSPPWWKFRARRAASSGDFKAQIGRQHIPALREGRATLEIAATNNSWGRFFRGGRSEIKLDVPVRFHPPEVEILTPRVYVIQGGCDLVLFRVSQGTSESGVRVGKYFFRSWPVKESLPDTRMCLFAFPYDVDPNTPTQVVARDIVGNESASGFSCQIIPQKFYKGTINLSDDFMERVVPAILSHTPEIQDEGNLLKNYVTLNRHLRMIDAQLLVAYSQKTAPKLLWTQGFLRFPRSMVEAHFADYRTYLYNGQVVDEETHLGYDLASTAHSPVPAANDGVVVFAQYFGIYGNAILIDHGCGLQTLYGHLSSFAVKAGDHVTRGQIIGQTGETGLAGGDHLHFSILLDGVFVNPFAWWDPHWVRDRIIAKLEPYR